KGFFLMPAFIIFFFLLSLFFRFLSSPSSLLLLPSHTPAFLPFFLLPLFSFSFSFSFYYFLFLRGPEIIVGFVSFICEACVSHFSERNATTATAKQPQQTPEKERSFFPFSSSRCIHSCLRVHLPSLRRCFLLSSPAQSRSVSLFSRLP